MDESVLDTPTIDTAAIEAAAIEAAAMADAPPELEGYADMAGLEEGQQVMLQLPDAERAGTSESVIMEVVRVDGNQIHFISPDPSVQAGATAAITDTDPDAIKSEQTAILQLPDGAEFTDTAGAEDGGEEMEEVVVPCCFLCLRPSGPSPLHCLILGRTEGTACSLAERVSSCAAPLRLNVSTADGVCDGCLQLINTADEHFHQYQIASEKITEMVRAAGGDQRQPDPAAAPADGDAKEEDTEKTEEEDELKQEPLSPVGGDDSDSDWSPSGLAPRSTRSRVPKVLRRWSPEPIERLERPAAPPPKKGPPRGRGRPRKHPVVQQPTVIEYTDIDTLKEQVKDLKTTLFKIKPANRRPAKSDLEKIIHLEVRTADGGSPAQLSTDASAGSAPRGRGRPPGLARTPANAYECRRCDIQFEDSSEMVKHLRQHVSKPWCKRCRTEFPNREALLDHRRACRLRHRSGHCHICDREVKFYRHHMRRHADMVQEGTLEAGAPMPVEVDHPPPSVQKRVGKFLAGGICSICGEHVPEKLRKHERSHNITHTCPICKKVFTREDVVRGHIKRVHMKERPHVCAQCGKTFVSVYSLQRHEMIHNNEYRFYCQECGDGFRQKQQLTAHMRHKHGVVDVVFEDVQVMPEGAAVVDALSVITDQHGAVYEGAVLEPGEFDKEEYVITAAADEAGEHVQFTAVADADGHLHLET